jgi:hypothetical protein
MELKTQHAIVPHSRNHLSDSRGQSFGFLQLFAILTMTGHEGLSGRIYALPSCQHLRAQPIETQREHKPSCIH